MGLLDKAKAAAEQAAARAKEGVEDVQLKRELGQAYNELGSTTFELVDAGEVSHERLAPLVDRVRDLRARANDGASPASSDGDVDPGQPPAMPN